MIAVEQVRRVLRGIDQVVQDARDVRENVRVISPFLSAGKSEVSSSREHARSSSVTQLHFESPAMLQPSSEKEG